MKLYFDERCLVAQDLPALLRAWREIVSANYGRINGDIGIDPRDTKTCMILFTYFLNPTSLDRNMEWDPKRNSLSGLSWEDSPRQP
jgi:hypothetical protein